MMGALKKRITQWCFEQGYEEPSFERITTRNGQNLPPEEHQFITKVGKVAVNVPAIVVKNDTPGNPYAEKNKASNAEAFEDRFSKVTSALAEHVRKA